MGTNATEFSSDLSEIFLSIWLGWAPLVANGFHESRARRTRNTKSTLTTPDPSPDEIRKKKKKYEPALFNPKARDLGWQQNICSQVTVYAFSSPPGPAVELGRLSL